MQPVVSDIYDKLSIIPANLAQQFQVQFNALKAQITNATNQATAQAASTVVPASGGGGGGGGIIPGPPTPTGDITVIVDTFANRDVNYPPSSYATGTLYVTNDRQTIYYNSSIAWTLVAGMGFGLLASRYNDLGVNDSGWVWYATDLNSISVWDGTAWIVISTESVLAGTHGDRISYGNATVAGSVVTATSGLDFQSYWVGNQISIGGVLFKISVVTDSTHLTVIGTPTAGATVWYFSLFPATQYPRGELYIETDRQVMYTVGVGSGTCNLSHFLVSWVSGPFFSGYWVGQTITINGIDYEIGTATLTAIGLVNDSGLVSSGLAWTLADSVWYYEVGTYHAGTVNKPVDLNPYSDLGFQFHDTTVGVQYYGVLEAAYSATTLYLAWMAGTEPMTYAAFTGRTFYASDGGYTVDITDYEHTIIWDGANWRWSPGDGSKYFQDSDGTQPNGGVWQLCDGSTVNVMIITAGVVSLLSFTTPDTTGATFFRGGAYTGVVSPTSAPTFNASGLTFTGTPAVLTGSVSTPGFTGTPAVLTGTFAGSALANHSHSSPVGTTSGSNAFITGDFGTGTSQVIGANFAITAGGGSAAVLKTSANSAGTPAGTITMNSYTPMGVLSPPALTMNSYTPLGTIGGTGAVSAPIVGAGAPASMAFQRYLRR